MTREELIKMAREVIEKTTDVHEYHGVPAKFDPHEWVLEAMRAAYERGRRDADVPEPMFASTHNRVESENTGRG